MPFHPHLTSWYEVSLLLYIKIYNFTPWIEFYAQDRSNRNRIERKPHLLLKNFSKKASLIIFFFKKHQKKNAHYWLNHHQNLFIVCSFPKSQKTTTLSLC